MVRPVVIGTVQVRAPPQYPENPVKALVGSGVGMSVTSVPWAKFALHPVTAATPAVITQLMPAGWRSRSPDIASRDRQRPLHRGRAGPARAAVIAGGS